MRMLVALLLLIASSSAALATIKVCNEFSHPIHLAFAHETKDGWMTIAQRLRDRHPDWVMNECLINSNQLGGVVLTDA